MSNDAETALQEALQAAKEAGVMKYTVKNLINLVYQTRFIKGFEVYDGWEMPEPPIEGAFACVDMHGSDGLSIYWWHPDWGKYPSCFTSWDKMRELGLEDPLMDNDPLIEPDTGYRYKECLEAYRELGFHC